MWVSDVGTRMCLYTAMHDYTYVYIKINHNKRRQTASEYMAAKIYHLMIAQQHKNKVQPSRTFKPAATTNTKYKEYEKSNVQFKRTKRQI